MHILVHIGLPRCGAEQLQALLDEKRGQLGQKGVLYAGSIGRKNHTRLYMAASDPGHVDPLRFARGFAAPEAQERLQRMVADDLRREVERAQPELLVLSAHQLATLPNPSELERLKALLRPLSDDISLVAHVDEPARVLTRFYEEAVGLGRTAPLGRELAMAGVDDWRAAALAGWAKIAPSTQGFPELQGVPHWLDIPALVALWEGVFGTGSLTLRPYDPARFSGPEALEEIRDMLGITENIGKAEAPALPDPPAAATLARWRRLNEVFVRLLETGKVIPRPLWANLQGEVAVAGAPTDPGSLAALSARFARANAPLIEAHPHLAQALTPPAPTDPWQEPDPLFGFRATQYAAAFLPRIDAATKGAQENQARSAVEALAARRNGSHVASTLTPTAERILSERAKENWAHLKGGRFAPHNNLGRVNEEELAAPFDEPPPRSLPAGSSGNVIVSCMKNEAPYILEWIAYHRMIGVDHFIVYTNDCTDGTDELLDRLQALGLVTHELNNDWKGNSPQQHALNKAVKTDLLKRADWVIHIDVDEFINIRVGNGTLDDFFARVPGATNVAMTWRLFGHNGVEAFSDELIIGQFTSAAPRYCPKPHTTWGFKTMTKNTGAYEKLSCHRPNKPQPGHELVWVNGNGRPMGENYHKNGWRSDLKSIGYDMLQLNHYALRSAESFLVKRQRGRALHVDRSIGLNYWVRMDWGGNRDVTILRNIPRVKAEMARLLADPELKRLHEAGVKWHKDKATALRAEPEFAELYDQALATDLTEMERVAFALALDMES